MGILTFVAPSKVMSKADWKSISADGAPPGVYTPNMTKEAMLLWKAKHYNAGKENARIEISKTFYWNNGLSYPNHEGYSAQCKIVVQKKEPRVIMSTNGKIAMGSQELVEFQLAIQEALQHLNV